MNVNNPSEQKLIDLGIDELNKVETASSKEEEFINKLVTDLPNVYQNSQRPLSEILQPLISTNSGQQKISELDGILYRSGATIQTYILEVKQFEDGIVNDNDLTSKEKVAMLTSTSVARYSTYFWSEYLSNAGISDHANADIGAAGGASLAAAGISFFFGPVAPAAYLLGVGISAGVASGLSWLNS